MTELRLGDSLEVLRGIEAESLDSMVTDPPAGISFMGKEWDRSEGFIPFMTTVMKECLRVLKPGAFGLVWAIPRTSHWTATALEQAGFEIRDVITHLFGSGFPKSLNVGKQTGLIEHEGIGTALKPASEHWILVRKPCSEKTVAANVLKWGCGGINIDASRIVSCDQEKFAKNWDRETITDIRGGKYNQGTPSGVANAISAPQGRFPANLILSHNDDCIEVGVKKVKAARKNDEVNVTEQDTKFGQVKCNEITTIYGNGDGTETVSAFECTPECAVAELDRQSGVSKSQGGGKKAGVKYGTIMGKVSEKDIGDEGYYGDSGGASRFFYCAKASKRERNEGCEGLPEKEWDFRDNDSSHLSPRAGAGRTGPTKNHHPTVKSIKLMSYLITMVTPPSGTVLDPFMGSGSTGVAALDSGFQFVGIEREAEYFKIAQARVFHKFPEFKKKIYE